MNVIPSWEWNPAIHSQRLFNGSNGAKGETRTLTGCYPAGT